jgi:hypothetical protein
MRKLDATHTVVQLKAVLDVLGLKRSGTKPELVKRVYQHLRAAA